MDRSLLILDEDRDYCDLLEEIFSQAEYTVTVGATDWDLSARLKELNPSIVVLDYKFGSRRGIEIVREVHATLPQTKVMVVSGPLAEQTIRALIAEEIDGLFTKPLKPISFLKRASDLLSGTSVSNTADDDLQDKKPGFAVSGHRLTSFPGRSQASRAFGEKVGQIRAFKSRLLLVGEEGSPFKQVTRDIVDAGRREDGRSEAIIYFDQHDLDLSTLETQGPQLKSEGFSGVCAVLLQADCIGEEESLLIRQLQSDGGFADRYGLSIRFIFCLSSELDELYDSGKLSTNVYMTLGATELRVPRLKDCAEDIPLIAQRMIEDLAEIHDMEVIPQLDESARIYLREYNWTHGFDELNVSLDSVLARTTDEVISQAHFPEEGGQSGTTESLTPLKRYLLRERDEYVLAVVELCHGDLKRAAESLGVSEDAIRDLIEN